MKTISNIKTWIVAALIGLTATASAQTLHSGYFLESMVQRHEMNAAFGGEANYIVLPALNGIQLGVYTNFGLSNYVFERNGQMVTALSSQVSASEFLNRLPNSQRLHFSLDIPVVSVGFRAMGGYNTIVLKERTMIDAAIPSSIMAFIKQGQDPTTGIAHYDVDNMGVRINAFSEIALGHSRKLDALDGFSYGAKVKFLFGTANASLNMEHIGIDFSRDSWTVTSQGYAQYSNNVVLTQTSDGNIEDFNMNSFMSGFGLGFDLGAVYTPAVLPDLTVSLAVNDIGFISWQNMHQAVSSGTYAYTGFDNLGGEGASIEEQLNDMLDDVIEIVDMKDAGQKTETHTLNATLNVGVEYAILNRKISFGVLSSTRFAGAYTYAEGMAVVNFRPLSWLHLAVNGSYSTYGGAVGALVNIYTNGFNLFFGSDYISPTMKFNNVAIPINPVSANFRFGISFPFGIRK